MPPPSLLARFRQTIGRALRETGQTLDRVGVWGAQHAVTTRVVGDDPYPYDDHLSRHRSRMPLVWRGEPHVHPDAAYIAPCSHLVGRVSIGSGSSVWYGAVLRADAANCGVDRDGTEAERRWRAMTPEQRLREDRDTINDGPGGGGIYVGSGTNVQDGAVLTSAEDHAVVGDYVTIGHGAHIHSARVGDCALIGMGSVLNPGSVVESEAFVAAGAVVGRGEVVREGELWAGNPARKLRDLTDAERARLRGQAQEYVGVAGGQARAMELGGNIPEEVFEHLQIEPKVVVEEVPEEEQTLEPEKVERIQSEERDEALVEKEQAKAA